MNLYTCYPLFTRGVEDQYRHSTVSFKQMDISQRYINKLWIWYDFLPTLRQIWRGNEFQRRNMRSKMKCSCVLQFTLINVACYVLHQSTSRVIHGQELCFSCFFLFFTSGFDFTCLPKETPHRDNIRFNTKHNIIHEGR